MHVDCGVDYQRLQLRPATQQIQPTLRTQIQQPARQGFTRSALLPSTAALNRPAVLQSSVQRGNPSSKSRDRQAFQSQRVVSRPCPITLWAVPDTTPARTALRTHS